MKETIRQRKRVLAVLLVFAMILSMCSSMGTIVAKAAEGGVTFVSRTDFLNKLEKMNAEFTGFDMNGNTTIKSITFEYTAPSDTYTISDVNFAESELEVIYGAYKESEDGSGYDVYFWADNEAKIMAPENSADLFAYLEGMSSVNFANFNTSNVYDMQSMFWSCESLEKLDLSNFDTTNVIQMSYMFYNCNSLQELNVTDFNTSNVTSMTAMFYGCSSLIELDVTNFNTSNVTGMSLMFEGCSSLEELNLTGFNTSKVTDMQWMFRCCNNLVKLDVTGFDTSNVIDMNSMFWGCSNLEELDVTGFNTSNVINISNMFEGCSSLEELDVTGFDTSNATNLNYMFLGLESLITLDLSNFTISSDYQVGDAGFFQLSDGHARILYTPKSYPLDTVAYIGDYAYVDENGVIVEVTALDNTLTESLQLGKVYDIVYQDAEGNVLTDLEPAKYVCGYGCMLPDEYEWTDADGNVMTEISTDIYGTVTVTQKKKEVTFVSRDDFATKLEIMNPAFTGLAIVDGNLPEGNTTIKNITFAYVAPENVYNISDVNFAEDESSIIHGAYKATEDGSGYDVYFWADNEAQIMAPMDCLLFKGCKGVQTIDFTNFDTSNTMYMYSMFDECNSLKKLDLSGFDTSNVVQMDYMFYHCTSLEELDLTNFDTSNVYQIMGMFWGCENLKKLNLSKFDTSNITSLASMFYQCISLEELDISGFNTAKVINMDSMFSGCSSLIELDITGFDTSNVTNMNNMFSGLESLITLDLSNFTISSDYQVGDAGFVLSDGSVRILYTPKSYPLVIPASIGNYAYVDENGAIVEVTALDNTLTESLKLGKVYDIVYQDAEGNVLTDLAPSRYVCGYGCTLSDEYEWTDAEENVITEISTDTYGIVTVTQKKNEVTPTPKPENPNPVEGEVTFVSRDTFATKLEMMNPEFTGLTAVDDELPEGNTNIKSITFAYVAPEDSYTISDVDFAEYASEVIYGAYKEKEDGSGYDVYFWAEEEAKIMALEDSSNLFGHFKGMLMMNLENFDTSNVTDMNGMFMECSSLIELDVTGFDTSKVTNMTAMFFNCSSLTKLNVTGFDTANVTDMLNMFRACSNLIELNLSNFDTSNVKIFRTMFYDCTKLKKLDLSNFDTSNATDMRMMFYECNSLLELDLSNFDTSNVINIGYMFYNCNSLISLDLSNFIITSNCSIRGNCFSGTDSLRSLYTPQFWQTTNSVVLSNFGYIDEDGTIIPVEQLDNTLTESLKLGKIYTITYQDAQGNILTDLTPTQYVHGYVCELPTEFGWSMNGTDVITELEEDVYGDVTLTVHTHNVELVPAVEATCTTEGNKAYYRCIVNGCNKVFTDETATMETTVAEQTISVLGHDFAELWFYDEAEHWQKCQRETCNFIKNHAVHTYDNDMDTECNVCNYTRTVVTPTPEPTPTVTPLPTVTPTPATGPSITVTPKPTAIPTPTATPSPTVTPVPTATPIPTATPVPTATPTPTETPSPTATPAPTATPSPTATPAPTATPSPTATPVPTATPTTESTPVPEKPTPTPTPEHIHSIQLVPVVAATCTTAGNQAYYVCTEADCGKVFTDVEAKNETTVQAVTLPAMGHSFRDGSCTTPSTCVNCGVTQGTALGHNFTAATCLTPSTCVTCGVTEGSARGHNYSSATCTQDSVCYDCGAYGASAYGHNFGVATCTEPSTCRNCGETRGSALGHVLDGTWEYDKNEHWQICTTCGEIVDLGKHIRNEWFETEVDGETIRSKICTTCGKELVRISSDSATNGAQNKDDKGNKNNKDKKNKEFEGSVTVPVVENATVQVTAEVQNQEAEIQNFVLDEWKEAVQGTEAEETVVIDFSALDAYIEAVSLPTDFMQSVLDEVKDETNQTKGMSIALTTGTVELDEAALEAVTNQAKGEKIHLHVDDVGTERLNEAQNKAIEHLDVHGGIEAYFTSSEQRIGDFKGGNVTVKIPFNIPKKLEVTGFSIWYVDKNGQTTKYACTYEDGYLVFTVDHFSDFLIVYDVEDVIDEEELARATEVENFAVAFAPLRLKVAKVSKTTQELEWKVCNEADGYVIYGSKEMVISGDSTIDTSKSTIGTKESVNMDKLIPLTVIRDKDTTTWTRYDLAEGTYYAYVIKAYKLVNNEMQFVTQSKTVYVTTNGGEYANTKRIQLNTKNFIMQKGSTFELVAEEILPEDSKKKKFMVLWFESTDKNVASIDQNGMITAKKAGVCQIYVMAQNGVTARLCVIVEK